MNEVRTSSRKTRVGKVVSDKMPLDIGNLMKWEQSYRKATSKKHYPLDYLYQQFPVRD